jgi:uncharacterized membrane protein YjgN (DUF898 family)
MPAMSETVAPTSAPPADAAVAAGVPAPPPPPAQRFAHSGRTRELLAITLINLLLKVVTVGIYHFWAKTRVRRYVWSHTLFDGDAFEYTGRGLELLLGYLVAMAVLVPLIAVLNLLPLLAGRYPVLVVLGSLAAYPIFVFLTGFATFSSRRYLLSRTRWRGIRFAMVGRARDHGFKMLLYGLLTAVTFGLYLPFMRNRLMKHLVEHAWFGSERLRYDGPDDALLRRFLLCGGIMLGVFVAYMAVLIGVLLLLLPLLRQLRERAELAELAPAIVLAASVPMILVMFIPWLWYRAGELRHFVAHTLLKDARFRLELSTPRYIWLYVSNFLSLLFTLGLAYPWVVVRTARTLAGTLRLEGALDVASIQQSAHLAPRTGEGLADALDLGAI